METFSALRVICAGNSPVPGEFPAQRPVTRSFDGFFICVWINDWVNNREAGDLRCYRAHYEVIVMWCNINILHVSHSSHTIASSWNTMDYSVPLEGVHQFHGGFQVIFGSCHDMMTSWHGHTLHVTDPLWHFRWFPSPMTIDAELGCLNKRSRCRILTWLSYDIILVNIWQELLNFSLFAQLCFDYNLIRSI